MEIKDLKEILRKAWTVETCYSKLRGEWDNNTPEIGQCAITSLIVQDYFGGDIIYCNHLDHYWNKFEEGEHDLTKEQFSQETKICQDGLKFRENLLSNKDTKKRYELLKRNLEKFIE